MITKVGCDKTLENHSIVVCCLKRVWQFVPHNKTSNLQKLFRGILSQHLVFQTVH